MEQFEGNLDHFNPNNQFAGDEKVPIQFYMGTMRDDAASEEAKRPIFKDIECIRIFSSRANIIDRPVWDQDLKRFPRAYAAWKATGQSEAHCSGMKLEHWPQMTRAQVEEYKFFKIFTVEQLAEMPDSEGAKFMGFHKLKNLAKAHVAAAQGDAPLVKMQQELDQRDGAISLLQSQVAALVARIDAIDGTGTSTAEAAARPIIKSALPDPAEVEQPAGKPAPKKRVKIRETAE